MNSIKETAAAQSSPTSSRGVQTVIRAGLHMDGNIRTPDDITLEGSIVGEVSANSVTIAAGATLSGIVSAAVVIVDGTVDGVIKCIKLQVNHSGAVSGEIYHTILVVEAGAAVEGKIIRSDHLPPATVSHPVREPVQAAESKAK